MLDRVWQRYGVVLTMRVLCKFLRENRVANGITAIWSEDRGAGLMSYGRDIHGVSAARGLGSPLCAATGETRITVWPSNGLNYDDRRKRFCKINENGKKTKQTGGEAKNMSARITRA